MYFTLDTPSDTNYDDIFTPERIEQLCQYDESFINKFATVLFSKHNIKQIDISCIFDYIHNKAVSILIKRYIFQYKERSWKYFSKYFHDLLLDQNYDVYERDVIIFYEKELFTNEETTYILLNAGSINLLLNNEESIYRFALALNTINSKKKIYVTQLAVNIEFYLKLSQYISNDLMISTFHFIFHNYESNMIRNILNVNGFDPINIPSIDISNVIRVGNIRSIRKLLEIGVDSMQIEKIMQ